MRVSAMVKGILVTDSTTDSGGSAGDRSHGLGGPDGPLGGDLWTGEALLRMMPPIDMVLHCPACGQQHIDAPEPIKMGPPGFDMTVLGSTIQGELNPSRWKNPPHRTHLCHGCGHKWRPADVCTNGVAAVKTKGKHDSPLPEFTDAQRWQFALATNPLTLACIAYASPAACKHRDPVGAMDAAMREARK